MTPSIDYLQESLPPITRSIRLLQLFGAFDAIGMDRISAAALNPKPTNCVFGNNPWPEDSVAYVGPLTG